MRAEFGELAENGFVNELELVEAYFFKWDAAGRPMDNFWDEDPIFMHDVLNFAARWNRQYQKAVEEWKKDKGLRDVTEGMQVDPTLEL